MAARRFAIRLSADEDALLKEIYLLFRTPIDQYAKLPDLRRQFVVRWNRRAERKDSEGDVIHYAKTKRKAKKWVTFDGNYDRHETTDYGITIDELKIAEAIYKEQLVDNQIGSDVLDMDPERAKTFAREFARRTGKIVPGEAIYAELMRKRKRGELEKIDPEKKAKRRGIGFDDLDELAN